MHFEAHSGLGWLIGILATRSVPPVPSPADADALAADRRLRAWCVGAAVLPDIDVVSYLWGEQAYGDYHHTFGHNLFLGVAFAALAGWRYARTGPPMMGADPIGRRPWLACALIVHLCFVSHLITDMKLSAYPVHLLWPLGHRAYEFRDNWGLAAPINTWLVYLSMVMAVVVAWWRGASPLELLSPRVDRMVLNAFRSAPLACASCEARPRPCNERCDRCKRPVCSRHGRVHGWFRLACPACA